MFCSVICSITTDSSIGKVDISALTEQTLMELFIEGIENKPKLWKLYGTTTVPPPIKFWSGLTFDSDDSVTAINWCFHEIKGTIQTQWLSSQISDIYLSENDLSGTVNLTGLPSPLQYLSLYFNLFAGTVCLTQLPENLSLLNLSANNFSGTLDLTQLPRHMNELILRANQFHGYTDFSQLPESLYCLDIASTKLSGTILMAKLSLVDYFDSQVVVDD